MMNRLKNRRTLSSLVVLAIVFLIAVFLSPVISSNLWDHVDKSDSQYEATKVERVVDGDTIVVNCGGVEKKVRLIGIDCPESVHSDESKNTQEGRTASAYTKNLLSEGQTVWLEKDVSDTDKFDRLLRYVWLDDPAVISTDEDLESTMLNAKLVYEGYAQAKEYKPDTKYANIFNELEKDAISNNRGVSYLWK